MYFVYLIRSSVKNWYYIGSCENLEERVRQHNKGRVRSTKFYAPFNLIYHEVYQDKTAALKRELKLKNNNQQKEILFRELKIK